MLEKRPDNDMAAGVRILQKKDYVDYHKFKHLHESNEEHLPLAPVLPGCAGGGADEAVPSPPKGRRALHKKKISQRPTCKDDDSKAKVTQADIQHQNIKRLAEI